ncbi:hypothetical protein [Bilophila wadsworthia]|uniref:hypothetical protein n=1 Tax=Bilophila wadsworthia TaxID=35833 RepID=UPI00302EE0E0
MKLHFSTIGEVAVKSLSVRQIKDFLLLDKADEAVFTKMMAAHYGLTLEQVDEFPAREWNALTKITVDYSLGKPVADIKNSFAGDDGFLMPIVPPTAKTAKK